MKGLSKSRYTAFCQCPKLLWLKIYKPEEAPVDEAMQARDYTDFVEGLRPNINANGFERRDGIFKAFCSKAANDYESNKDNKYVIIIDEINRGEISKVFGELFFSIDPGYRGTKGKVDTQYQNLIKADEKMPNDSSKDYPFINGFYVPENVFIIGTMNDIDRSVESMDFAFRRRFAFKEIKAEDSKAMRILGSILILKKDRKKAKRQNR